MTNILLNRYDSSNKEFSSTLDNYSINELVNLYINYFHSRYFMEHDNMEEILNYISSYVLKKLPNLSFIEIVNIYSEISVKANDILEALDNNQNRINSILYESNNNFILEQNAKTKNIDIEKYKKERTTELNLCEEFKEQWTPIYSTIDLFKKDIISYLNMYVCSVPDEEKEILLQQINEVIEENSAEISKGIELRQNKKKLNLHSKFKSLNEIIEIYEKMDTSKLEQQNRIYLNFKTILADKIEKKNKGL